MEKEKERRLSDLEKMTEERKKAESEYLESQQMVLNVKRIMREGISGVEDLVLYLTACISDVKHMEDLARRQNNTILYSETIAIRREFGKLLRLVMMDGSAQETVDGSEESHREKNTGEEGYQ